MSHPAWDSGEWEGCVQSSQGGAALQDRVLDGALQGMVTRRIAKCLLRSIS